MSQHAHDPYAEQALLGAMIIAPSVALPSFMAVPAEAYYAERHSAIAATMRDMVARSIPIDPVTLCAELSELGIINQAGGAPYIHTLMAACPTAVNADYWAIRLCELYGRRRLTAELVRETQRLDAAWESGEVTATAESVLRLRAALDEVTAYSACGAEHAVTWLGDFLAQEVTYEWLIPGLLERRDRLVLTGDEGFGKSELTTQIACCAAAGIHPFTGRPGRFDPLRVAVLDCENSNNQSRRRYSRIVGAVQSQRAVNGQDQLDWSKQLAVEFRTDGMNLLAGNDVAFIERFVSAVTPDILVIGPLYKLHREDENDGQAARAVQAALDGIRVRHNVAIITEAHSGHAKGDDGLRHMRPRGHSSQLGWPEFGLGLRRNKDDPAETADVVPWRGHRDERAWPVALFKARGGLLPWRPTAEYYDMDEPPEWSE